ncbi:MAG: cytochrome c oxidase assembly protein [Chloroflexi bacterium]|nr:cytochrome c oxidase assembly protein [Chloroflexota bacterium]
MWTVPIKPTLSLSPGSHAEFSWWAWHWHPDLYGGLLLLAGLYLLYIGPLRGRLVQSELTRASRWQVVSFMTGVLLMLFALAGPIHELSDNYLFSAHMTQHIMLTLVVLPLLLLGTPGWLLRPLVGPGMVLKLGRFLTLPLVAFALFNGVFALWHFPVFYEGALHGRAFHILEHLIFMATAVIVWWPVLSPLSELPRISYPAQMLYLVLLSLSQTPLFAVVTFSNDVIYSFYEAAPRVWDISPLADQQLGGIIMKVAWLVIFLPAICTVFLRWFYREEKEGRPEFQNTS